jgi:hypothetical protein
MRVAEACGPPAPACSRGSPRPESATLSVSVLVSKASRFKEGDGSRGLRIIEPG